MSLKARLLAATAAVALVALSIAGFVTYSQQRSFLYNQADQNLIQAGSGLTDAYNHGELINSFGQLNVLAVEQYAPGMYVAFRTNSGQLISQAVPRVYPQTPQVSPTISNLSGPPALGDPYAPYTIFNAMPTKAGQAQFRVYAQYVVNGYQLIVAQSLSGLSSTLNHLFNVEVEVAIAALALALALGWLLVKTGLRPLTKMEQVAETITAEGLNRRIPGETDTTEVGRLAITLNSMLGKIEDSFNVQQQTESELRASEARLRRFVADASHELRTPVAAVSAYAELFDRGADKRPEDLGRVMNGIRLEASRMGSLVEDLLLLARLDEGRPLEQVEVDLTDLVTESARTSMTVGKEWPVTIEITEPLEVPGDRLRLRQVIDNLLSNVRSHTPQGTTASIRVYSEGEFARIDVSDNGPGISPDDTKLAFERFFRIDNSRSRSSGGAGLGLAIVAAIVKSHAGKVSVESELGEGTTFSVLLPLSRPSNMSAIPSEGQVTPLAEHSANGGSAEHDLPANNPVGRNDKSVATDQGNTQEVIR